MAQTVICNFVIEMNEYVWEREKERKKERNRDNKINKVVSIDIIGLGVYPYLSYTLLYHKNGDTASRRSKNPTVHYSMNKERERERVK